MENARYKCSEEEFAKASLYMIHSTTTRIRRQTINKAVMWLSKKGVKKDEINSFIKFMNE